MDNTLANALQRTLGIQRPQSSEHACQLLDPVGKEITRLRGIAESVRYLLGTTDAATTSDALRQLKGG